MSGIEWRWNWSSDAASRFGVPAWRLSRTWSFRAVFMQIASAQHSERLFVAKRGYAWRMKQVARACFFTTLQQPCDCFIQWDEM
jgi:hypothetical protein